MGDLQALISSENLSNYAASSINSFSVTLTSSTYTYLFFLNFKRSTHHGSEFFSAIEEGYPCKSKTHVAIFRYLSQSSPHFFALLRQRPKWMMGFFGSNRSRIWSEREKCLPWRQVSASVCVCLFFVSACVCLRVSITRGFSEMQRLLL